MKVDFSDWGQPRGSGCGCGIKGSGASDDGAVLLAVRGLTERYELIRQNLAALAAHFRANPNMDLATMQSAANKVSEWGAALVTASGEADRILEAASGLHQRAIQASRESLTLAKDTNATLEQRDAALRLANEGQQAADAILALLNGMQAAGKSAIAALRDVRESLVETAFAVEKAGQLERAALYRSIERSAQRIEENANRGGSGSSWLWLLLAALAAAAFAAHKSSRTTAS